MQTVKIRLWGIVQGVGFRPCVAQLARRLRLTGQVRNVGGLVEIRLNVAGEAQLNDFLDVLAREKPRPAEIVHQQIEWIPYQDFADFAIVGSEAGDDETVMIPADLAVCPTCLREMRDLKNPRYRHPFISCMACGPRYTIIDSLPYDRPRTAMAPFDLCDACRHEYTTASDRRYHAQTISCHHCGPQLIQRSTAQRGDAALEAAMALLQNGEIIALKGLGGYNLLASPFRDDTVRRLRTLKGREEKPFAVMFSDVTQVRQYAHCDETAARLLTSAARPIVLLASRGQTLSPFVNQTSRFTGCFLPSLALHDLLLAACGPLIVTSANLSDMAMIYEDEAMFAFHDDHATLLKDVFYHDRAIRLRLDDSVVRIIDQQPQLIRRAKGYAPLPLAVSNMTALVKEDTALALGGHLKGCFSLSKGHFAYVSQYFGDLDSRDSREDFRHHIPRLQALLRVTPRLVAVDKHPLYFSRQWGDDYAREHGLPLLEVQHHHAHVASVMAEHGLEGPLIGVSFDGTGYGDDGAVWGGEFLLCRGLRYERLAHLAAVPLLGGDETMKDGAKAAMGYLAHYGGAVESGPLTEDPRYAAVKAALAARVNTVDNSSMGRLFDAVAAYANIHHYNRYEGECASQLENWAAIAQRDQITPLSMDFTLTEQDNRLIADAAPIFAALAESQPSPAALALGFHEAVARLILQVCQRLRERRQVNAVALTGGVFQNQVLMEKTLSLLRQANFNVYYNISVGANDGGIALGQNYLAMQYLLLNRVEKGN